MLSKSKIQSKSNSQQEGSFIADGRKLCSVNQRYNLKAIHNNTNSPVFVILVVLSKSKIQSKSNSQPLSKRTPDF